MAPTIAWAFGPAFVERWHEDHIGGSIAIPI